MTALVQSHNTRLMVSFSFSPSLGQTRIASSLHGPWEPAKMVARRTLVCSDGGITTSSRASFNIRSWRAGAVPGGITFNLVDATLLKANLNVLKLFATPRTDFATRFATLTVSEYDFTQSSRVLHFE